MVYTTHYTAITANCTITTIHSLKFAISQNYREGDNSSRQLRELAGTEDCTVYIVHCTLHIVHFTLYTVNCTLYTLYCSMSHIHWALYTPTIEVCQHLGLETAPSSGALGGLPPHAAGSLRRPPCALH